ncbi:MAG: ATP-binding protein [Chloroflexi bacterium]|nr:ATP-binding protein [Chloroflexota bacterium]
MRQISKEQVLQRIRMENTWLEAPHELPPVYGKWNPRAYFDLLYPLVKNRKARRAIVLLGPRRVGKTVLIHHVIQRLIVDGVPPSHICYVSVDHPLYNGLDLEQLLAAFSEIAGINYSEDKLFVFFDEIQYLRHWELYLKAVVDRYPNVNCIVSGSAAAALRLKSRQSGAGRMTEFLLPPLTFYEYIEFINKSDLVLTTRDGRRHRELQSADIQLLNQHFIDYINYGGYPEVIFFEDIKQNLSRYIKSDIIDKVLLRDLPSLYGIQNIQELNSLFTNLAFNTGNEISLDELSTGSGLAKNTIKRYIEYLEAAFLIRTVQRVDVNAKRFKRANFFKVYLTNPSMWSALFSPVQTDDVNIGHLVETAIFSQWFHAYHTGSPLHYARWKNGEVDIVNVSGKEQKADWAVETKWTDRPYQRHEELKNLMYFCRNCQVKTCLVTTLTKQGEITIDNTDVTFLPASLYAYELGYNIIRELRPRLAFERVKP